MTAAADRERADDLIRTLLTARYGEKDEEAIAFAGNLVAHSFAAIRREALLEAAKAVEGMRPAGGRQFDDAQRACYAALTDAGAAIRNLIDGGVQP